jgi:hypothetical protein
MNNRMATSDTASFIMRNNVNFECLCMGCPSVPQDDLYRTYNMPHDLRIEIFPFFNLNISVMCRHTTKCYSLQKYANVWKVSSMN